MYSKAEPLTDDLRVRALKQWIILGFDKDACALPRSEHLGAGGRDLALAADLPSETVLDEIMGDLVA